MHEVYAVVCIVYVFKCSSFLCYNTFMSTNTVATVVELLHSTFKEMMVDKYFIYLVHICLTL